MFIGPDGLRSGWRVLIFIAIFFGLFPGFIGALGLIPGFHKVRKEALAGTLTPAFELVFESVQFGTALLVAWIISRFEKRKLGEYGIPLTGAFGKHFWQGIVWGLAYLSLELLAMKALGGFSYGGLALGGLAIVWYAAVWALGFVLVGLAEEFVFRGYAQFTLASGIGFWPAAVLLSAAFGGLHLFNSGEDWVGAVSVFVFGMFACFTLKRTGSLWFAIGFHAAGDYSESFIYAVPNSGTLATGHLLHSSAHGPAWLTGGTVGPEGSVLAFVMFLIAFLLFGWLYPSKPSELRGSSQTAPQGADL
ncbi:MAG: type II CAAX endopeptidase family protein [Candidatus Acidiferrales bacterium]